MRGASKTVRVAGRARWIAPAVVGLIALWASAHWSHLLPIGGVVGGPDPSAARAAPPTAARSMAPSPAGMGVIGAAAPAAPVAGARPVLAAPFADAGEYAPQAALLISATELATCMPEVFRDVVQAAHGRVTILCMVSDLADRSAATRVLKLSGLAPDAVRFVHIPLDTMWVRDYGPLFAQRPDGSVWVLDMDYSADEEGAEVRWRDNNAPRLLGEALGLPVEALPLRLAGGNVLTNGGGIVVTTSSVLRDNADRGYSAEKIRALFRRRLGCSRWVCLPELDGERTGHVDMYVTFPAENVAVVSRLDAEADPVNAAFLDQAAEQLSGLPTRRGPMKVYRIPMDPGTDGIWRSYTNVIYANGALLVPSFTTVAKERQAEAFALYAKLLPGWKIVPIGCDELACNEGLLHCICRNVPSFVPIPPAGAMADDDERCLDLALEPGADGAGLPAGPGEILREDFPGAAAEPRPGPDESFGAGETGPGN